MRGSVMGSGVVHVALLVTLLVVRGPIAHIVPGPEVVQVALIDPSAVAPPAPTPAPAPPPETKPVEVKPDEETGVKLEPVKPKKAKPVERKPQERPRAAAAPALPSARLGETGLSGDVTVDATNFEFTYYLVLVRNRIASNWTPPAGLATGGNPVRAVVYFRIGRGGEIIGIRLETGSGAEFFDRAALRSVVISDPMPPLPLGFSGGDLGVHFGFEWESP